MIRSLLFCFLLVMTSRHAIMAAEDLSPATLEEALWQGQLVIRVEGPIYSQILENELNEAGQPTGFIKEKGSMSVDYSLALAFQVNAIGEFTLSASELFRSRQILDSEYWHHFQEEVEVDKGVRMKRRVKVSEVKSWVHDFDHADQFDQDTIGGGTIRFIPDGRMDKKGTLTIKAEFQPEFKGVGQLKENKERQPPTKEFNKSTTTSPSSIKWSLPLQFEVTIQHRKDAVSGSFAVMIETVDPFSKSSRKRKASDVYSPNLKATGTYSMTPLFGKK